MNSSYDEFMKVALEEAKTSLKEGNNGFGAVIVKDNKILLRTHDKEETESDPTSHAELNAIRLAAQKCGRNLESCILISTHEPCPMCITAIIWSGIKILVYGYSINEAIAEGRKRFNITCKELLERANINIQVEKGIMHDQCALLYRKDIRAEIKKLRGARKEDLELLQHHLLAKRIEWYKNNYAELKINKKDLIFSGYELLLKKLDIKPEEAPIVTKTKNKLIFHSKNYCPTLEACKIF